jgi:hypothetical protein
MIECDWCDGTGLTPGTGNQCQTAIATGWLFPTLDDLSSEPKLNRPWRKAPATQDGAAVTGARVITRTE